jgi:hypothetical protein
VTVPVFSALFVPQPPPVAAVTEETTDAEVNTANQPAAVGEPSLSHTPCCWPVDVCLANLFFDGFLTGDEVDTAH